MTKSELETLLRKAGKLAHERDFFLIGSQALRGICSRIPRDFPQTYEADLYPRRRPQAWSFLRAELGNHSRFFRQSGYYLDCVDPALSTLPDGWVERLIPFRTARTAGVTAWCLEPHDLFVNKLVAWLEKDQQFLRAMLRHKFAKRARVLQRIGDLPLKTSEKVELRQLVENLVAEARTTQSKPQKRT